MKILAIKVLSYAVPVNRALIIPEFQKMCLDERTMAINSCIVVVKCPIHKIDLVCYCPACRGAVTSKRKAAASRTNGRLGGRPQQKRVKPASLYQRERRAQVKAAKLTKGARF